MIKNLNSIKFHIKKQLIQIRIKCIQDINMLFPLLLFTFYNIFFYIFACVCLCSAIQSVASRLKPWIVGTWIGYDLKSMEWPIQAHCSPVGPEVSSDVTLVDYLRNYLELRGTKYMCRQAGCGACIVAASRTPGATPQAINSCMVSITSCRDWDITTIEELGNRKKGYHVLQKSLASHNGSQCGHCSPGWIMSMYCLLQSKSDLSMLEIEKSFASNICRCTGYRPILEAFKSFAKDAPKTNLLDIEDLNICKRSGKVCRSSCSDDEDWCVVNKKEIEENVAVINLKDGRKWFLVNKVMDIFSILNTEGIDSYMLVAGNTAKGAYPITEYPRTLIDTSGITELKGHIIDQNLVIGAGTTLTELLQIFQNVSQREEFIYLKEFYDHLQQVAHIAVRNLGTIAGNLMIKHQHNDFSSDLFLMFTTAGAYLTLINNQSQQLVSMEKFLGVNMTGTVILNVKLPPLKNCCTVKTYEVMPRSQNAHAIVNFGALYEFNTQRDQLLNCRLVYGGLSPSFSRAVATEKFLARKPLFVNETLQAAIKILENELIVVEMPPEPSAAYRKKLAIGLFYKSLLSLCPKSILSEKYRSGSIKLRDTRPVSEASQSFETSTSLWPLNQPIPKIESLIQCAGEASYTEDLPLQPHEVFAEIVLSSISKGTIVLINPSKALDHPGVIAFYAAKDIPGLNSFTPDDDLLYERNEEVFCTSEVEYYNQPIGVIVARTRHIAEIASNMVEVTYENVSPPLIDIKVAKTVSNRNRLFANKDATERGKDAVVKTIKGSNTIYGQYHFTMETLVCITRPTEEGLEVYAACQWPDGVQTMVARALNMDASRIDVHVRRLGGGFGIKISRIILAAVACSLVTKKLNLPCRIIHSMEKVMRAFGKRLPCSSDYEFAVNNSGVIQYGNYAVYEDHGYGYNENLQQFGVDSYGNCYNKARWNYTISDTTTDMAMNTWFRGPGTLENIAMTEMVMEHISYELSLDPIQTRLANLGPESSDIKMVINTMISECSYNERRTEVNRFNAQNRWKKRGFRFIPMQWNHNYPRYFDVNMSVYHVDGTIVITHGGIEIGQGINTRTAQICAYYLKVPLDIIQVKAFSSISAPNSTVTGGSITSQNIGVAMGRCCEELLKRLEPVRAKLGNPTWPELIKQAFTDGVDLQIHGFVGLDDVFIYNFYGVAFAEVEIDVLTGEVEVLRVDTTSDAGQSVSPALDIGQVEGAFIMGQGYWMCEQLVYDKKTGELLTNRPWNYYVPQARDIPQDFRVYLRKKSYSLPAILGSKMTGEPPICMTIVVPMAIREAITSARYDSGIPTTTWYPFDGPSTAEYICMSASTRTEEFKFN